MIICASSAQAQLTGKELLDKAIAYHDPLNKWSTFQGAMQITMQTENRPDRASHIQIDLPAETFQIAYETGENDKLEYVVVQDSCSFKLDGNEAISDADKNKHKLTDKRAKLWRNYYTYLYGLPMKLKDPGTIIDPITQRKTFKGKEYLVLKATYENTVGKDTWYFYFDPQTYAMEIYQFYKVEANNDGEYILLSDEVEIAGIKMPKTRAWYYNKDDKYLGTDVLNSVN